MKPKFATPPLEICKSTILGAFNQETALVGAFSVIVKTDGSFAALFKMFKSSAVRTISQQAAGSQCQFMAARHDTIQL